MCSLCLDWKGGHTKENCRSKVKGKFYKNCNNGVDGKECGLRHHSLLHDCKVHEEPRVEPKVSFCNGIRGIIIPQLQRHQPQLPGLQFHPQRHQSPSQDLQSHSQILHSQHSQFNYPHHSPELLSPGRQFLPSPYWPSHPKLKPQLPILPASTIKTTYDGDRSIKKAITSLGPMARSSTNQMTQTKTMKVETSINSSYVDQSTQTQLPGPGTVIDSYSNVDLSTQTKLTVDQATKVEASIMAIYSSIQLLFFLSIIQTAILVFAVSVIMAGPSLS